MKQLVVLFCVSVCCISTAVGYQGLPLLSLPEPPHLHKRQSESELDQQRRCMGILLDTQCNNGFIQEQVDIALRCNMASVAITTQLICERNSDGVYCSLLNTDLDNLTSLCAPTPCSSECRERLVSLREGPGCCINSINNTEINEGLTPDIFSYDLWSRCNVQPVTEQCRSVPLPQTEVDPSCDSSIFLEENIETSCLSRFIEPVVDALMETEGCQPLAQEVLDSCRVNEMGERCAIFGSLSNTLFIDVQDACRNLTCSQECVQALQTLNQTAGCCLNTRRSSNQAGIVMASQGGVEYAFLTNEFWSECGLQTPGECEVRLNGAAQPQAPVNGTENGAVQLQGPGIAVLLIAHLATLIPTWIVISSIGITQA